MKESNREKEEETSEIEKAETENNETEDNETVMVMLELDNTYNTLLLTGPNDIEEDWIEMSENEYYNSEFNVNLVITQNERGEYKYSYRLKDLSLLAKVVVLDGEQLLETESVNIREIYKVSSKSDRTKLDSDFEYKGVKMRFKRIALMGRGARLGDMIVTL